VPAAVGWFCKTTLFELSSDANPTVTSAVPTFDTPQMMSGSVIDFEMFPVTGIATEFSEHHLSSTRRKF